MALLKKTLCTSVGAISGGFVGSIAHVNASLAGLTLDMQIAPIAENAFDYIPFAKDGPLGTNFFFGGASNMLLHEIRFNAPFNLPPGAGDTDEGNIHSVNLIAFGDAGQVIGTLIENLIFTSEDQKSIVFPGGVRLTPQSSTAWGIGIQHSTGRSKLATLSNIPILTIPAAATPTLPENLYGSYTAIITASETGS